jgi:hypothetical protein
MIALKALGLGFAGGEAEQKRLHQRGHGRVPLNGDHSDPPVGFIIRQVLHLAQAPLTPTLSPRAGRGEGPAQREGEGGKFAAVMRYSVVLL